LANLQRAHSSVTYIWVRAFLIRFCALPNEKNPALNTILFIFSIGWLRCSTLFRQLRISRYAPSSLASAPCQTKKILRLMVLLKSHQRFASRPYAKLSQISDLVKATAHSSINYVQMGTNLPLSPVMYTLTHIILALFTTYSIVHCAL